MSSVQKLLTQAAVSILVQHKTFLTVAFEHPIMQFVTKLLTGTAMPTAACKQRNNTPRMIRNAMGTKVHSEGYVMQS
jgi:hypothetical protein